MKSLENWNSHEKIHPCFCLEHYPRRCFGCLYDPTFDAGEGAKGCGILQDLGVSMAATQVKTRLKYRIWELIETFAMKKIGIFVGIIILCWATMTSCTATRHHGCMATKVGNHAR